MHIFIFTLMLIFTLIGLCDAIHLLAMLLLNNKDKAAKFIVLFLNGKNDYIELTRVIEEYKWQGKGYADKIFAYSENPDSKILETFSNKGIVFLKSTDNICQLPILGVEDEKSGNKRYRRENYI